MTLDRARVELVNKLDKEQRGMRAILIDPTVDGINDGLRESKERAERIISDILALNGIERRLD